MATEKFNIAILISGRGSNMKAILEELSEHQNANFSVIISDNQESTGLSIAKKYDIPTAILHRSNFDNKQDFEEELLKILNAHRVNLILLAGFMTILSKRVIAHYPKKILNIHPSLLPKYRGLNSHQKVIKNGDKETGATVHLVDEGIDTGTIIDQIKITIETPCDAASLAKKLLPQEHQLYTSVVKKVLDYHLNLTKYKQQPS